MRRYDDSSASRAAKRGPDRGFALIAALGMALALALIATATVREGRVAARVAAHAVEAAQARAAAEAGLWRAAAALAADGEAGGAARTWVFEGVAVRVEVALARDRTDLNRAAPEALEAAAAASGHPDPEGFAEAVLARRAALEAAGVAWRLDPRAFDSIDQARDLASASVWPRLAPRLTTDGVAATAQAQGSAPAPGEVALLRAEATHPAGARAAIEARLRLEPGGGFTTLGWRAARPSGDVARR